VYQRYLQAARIGRINALNAELEELTRLERTIDRKASALRRLRREKSEIRQHLDINRREHEALLAHLDTEIEDGETTLARMRGDEQKLEALVAGLREELESIPALEEQAQSFASLRGTLQWPSSGRLLHQFGAKRESDNQSWQGVLIGTDTGAPVTAVSHGRVAFADWLRGFGLLLIIDHGEGYMSLYGRNQSLFKEVGDWVAAGELIAVVGTSGGEEETGLYFEIRNNGIPMNPARWCQGSLPPDPA
jgi:septal ring factor EnvC (AmiA/AmiB activator)